MQNADRLEQTSYIERIKWFLSAMYVSNGNRKEWSPIRSVIMSDNKIVRPCGGSPICLLRVWLQTELDDTKSINHNNYSFREKKNSQVMKEKQNLR